MNKIHRIHHFLRWNNNYIFLIATQLNGTVVEKTFNGLVTWNYIYQSFRTFTLGLKYIKYMKKINVTYLVCM